MLDPAVGATNSTTRENTMKPTNLTRPFTSIRKRVAALERLIALQTRQIKTLEKLGVRYNASALWKIQKTNKAGDTTRYLRISYGHGRPYEYIGKDPEKVKAALATIERGKKAKDLQRLASATMRELDHLVSAVRDVVREHC